MRSLIGSSPAAPAAAGRRAVARLALGVACGTALVAASAAPAHAQFGRLVKRAAAAATEAAAGAAAGRATNAAAAKAGVTSGAADAGEARDADQLDITAERLDAFLVAMRGPAAAAEQRAAYAGRRAAWDKATADYADRNRVYDACRTRFVSNTRPDVSPAALARQERIANTVTALADRSVQAQQAGNTALVARLADSVEVLQHATEQVLFPTLARSCGARPTKPASEPPSDDAPAANGPAFRPAVPAGMTPRQFGTLRERVAAWLLAADRRYVYAPAEQQALESRRAALAPLTPLFRGDHLAWGSYMHGLGKER